MPKHVAVFRLIGCAALALGLACVPSAQAQTRWLERPPDEVLRVALLLPFSGGMPAVNRLAQDLWDGAQLARQQSGADHVVLLRFDTKAHSEGGVAAVRAAMEAQAHILIGPLLSRSLYQFAQTWPSANHPPILALTNNRHLASENIWIFGHLPRPQFARLIAESVQRKRRHFAALLPRNYYGQYVESFLPAAIDRRGGHLLQVERYQRDPNAMPSSVRRIAAYDARHRALENERARLSARADSAGLARLARAETWGEVPYDAIILAETGQALKNLAALLPFYDVDMAEIQILLPHFWHDPLLARELPLQGAWYAGAPPEHWQQFAQDFRDSHGRAPARLASLSYDALLYVLHVAARDRAAARGSFSARALTAPRQFQGVDGRLRLTANGLNERLLAVLALHKGGVRLVDAAPRRFAR